MGAIVLIDASIYLNLLAVPGFDQKREETFQQFEQMVGAGDHFLLPMATIWQAGNHIADLPDSGRRREYALKFANEVGAALRGDMPWRATSFPERERLEAWLSEYPKYIQQDKSPGQNREGVSLADLSVIKEWEALCGRHPMSRVRIWALDTHLCGYDQSPG